METAQCDAIIVYFQKQYYTQIDCMVGLPSIKHLTPIASFHQTIIESLNHEFKLHCVE